MKNDKRYKVQLEYCGRETPRYVARFCNEFIGQASTRKRARGICEEYERFRWQAALADDAEKRAGII